LIVSKHDLKGKRHDHIKVDRIEIS